MIIRWTKHLDGDFHADAWGMDLDLTHDGRDWRIAVNGRLVRDRWATAARAIEAADLVATSAIKALGPVRVAAQRARSDVRIRHRVAA